VKFDHKRYVPCLRWKQGEYQAVSRLTAAAADALTPIIEVPEIGWDFENEEDAKTLDEHLPEFAPRVKKKWGCTPCFVDGRLLPPGGLMASGEHAMDYVFNRLRAEKCKAIPVTGPERAPEYKNAIRRAVRKDGRGMCIRIPLAAAMRASVKASVRALRTEAEVGYGEAHLVLDMGAPKNFEPMDGLVKAVARAISNLPHLDRWASFTLLGTSFPKTMAVVKRGTTALKRYEWLLYRQVCAESRKAGIRLPSFGDYAIQHPDIWHVDMRIVRPSASIRYSGDGIWLIVKGKNVRDYKFGQYRKMCKKVVSSVHFSGRSYSYGDGYIAACASGTGKTGSLPMWRCVGTNHHLEKVIEDVAIFYGSASSP